MMKIALVTRMFPSDYEPYSGTFVYEQAREIAKRVNLIVINPVVRYPSLPRYNGLNHKRKEIPKYQRLDGFYVYSPNYWYLPKVQNKYAHWNLALTFSLAIWHKARDAQLIHVHNAMPDAFAGLIAGRILRKPMVVTCHGSDINTWAVPELPSSRRLIISGLMHAQRVIAVSNALGQKIKELGIEKEKIRIISNGFNPDLFFPMNQHDCRKALGLPLDKRIYLSVGALRPVKGFNCLISAYGQLKRSGLDFVAYIIGEGKEREKLENQIKKEGLEGTVFLAGTFAHKEIPTWMNAADYVVVSSKNEGWPCNVVESIACGTPVLATPVGGIPKIITHASGYLGSGTSRKDLIDMITKGSNRTYSRTEVIACAQTHTWQSEVTQLMQVYKELC